MRKTWNVVRAFLRVGGWAFMAACAGLLALVGIGPHIGGYRTLSVLSGSMRPGIPVGAIVIVTPESPRELRVGQIVTYQIPVEDRRIVSHRVVEVVEGAGTDSPTFRTKGDANDAPDTWLATVSGPTVWQVRRSIPGMGQAIYWLRRPGVHTGAVRVVPAALAVLWLVGIWRPKPVDTLAAESAVIPT